jgi:hypothetical protein
MGTILDCSITHTGPAGTAVHSGLGALTVPPGSAFSPDKPLLFIPKDALSIADSEAAGEGKHAVNVYFRKAVFEGERLTWRLSLNDTNEEESQCLSLEPGFRREEPPAGGRVRCLIDLSLLRFVRE